MRGGHVGGGRRWRASYFGLDLEVGKEVCAAVAEGLKVLVIVFVGARVGLVVAIPVALAVGAGGGTI